MHARSGWIGFTSLVVVSAVVACTSSTTPSSDLPSPPVKDAGSVSVDAATDSIADVGTGVDAASTDAAPEADSAVVVRADVAKDFGTKTNPNGAWTYGYFTGAPTAGAPVPFSTVSNATPDIPAWYDPTHVALGAPAAWRNDSTASSNGIAPGEFALHPGQSGEYAIARWTAPAAGDYSVTVQFGAGDTGDTDGILLHNGVAVATDPSTSTGTVHTLKVSMAAGDHLDAAVGPKGDFLYDSTPVRLTIESVP
jgi:hypothetical protein